MSKILNIDTLNSNYLVNGTCNTFQNVNNVSYLSPNSFSTRILLPSPEYGISTVVLKNLQIPIAFNNIRSTSNLNTIGIYSGLDISGNKLNHYTIILPDGIYSTIQQLLTEINNLFLSNYPSINIVFSVYSNNNNYLQVTSTTYTNVYVDTTNLSKMLGFSSLDNINTNLTYTSYQYRLSIDDYINLYIANLPSSVTNANKTLCSFKIPLNGNNGIVYYNENIQTLYINSDPFTSISYLDIYIYDRFGYSLNSGGIDYSFTIELIYGL